MHLKMGFRWRPLLTKWFKRATALWSKKNRAINMKSKDKAFLVLELSFVLILFFASVALVISPFIEEARERVRKSYQFQQDLEKAHKESEHYIKKDQFHEESDQFFRSPEPYKVEWWVQKMKLSSWNEWSLLPRSGEYMSQLGRMSRMEPTKKP